MSESMQVIPARHGTATFVPRGSTIRIVNSSGQQIVDTWAFALPSPPDKLRGEQQADGEDKSEEKKEEEESTKDNTKDGNKEGSKATKDDAKTEADKTKKQPAQKKKKNGQMDLPSQEEAEATTAQGQQQQAGDATPKKAGWSSYIPSLGRRKNQESDNSDGDDAAETKKQQKEQSSRWSSYMPSGQAVSGYLPSKGALSAFAASHYRDPTKSYAQQLTDFSKTPVGAAGLSALSGSGTASSLYAGYSAWSQSAGNDAPMEYLSVSHTRAGTAPRLSPRIDDELVSNLRKPLLTVVEDTCAQDGSADAVHDTLQPACDPAVYARRGAEKPEEHGSCAENLILALKQLNDRAGLSGSKGVGALLTVNSVPAPLRLFSRARWGGASEQGEYDSEAMSNDSSEAKRGEYVRLRACRDVVVVLSACPCADGQREIQDGHFLVEAEEDGEDEVKEKLKRASAPPVSADGAKQPTKSTGKPGVKGKASATGAGKKNPPKKLGGAKKKTGTASNAGQARTEAGDKSASSEAGEADKENTDTATGATGESVPQGAADAAKGEGDKAAAGAPKRKPKKLVDSQTGEKRKPRKLAVKGSG